MSNDQDTRVAARTRLTSLRSYLESKGALEQVRKALPAGMTPERAVRQTMTLIQNNPGLLECTQVSILAGLIQTAELGLELSGPMGQAFLVPRHNRKKGGM